MSIDDQNDDQTPVEPEAEAAPGAEDEGAGAVEATEAAADADAGMAEGTLDDVLADDEAADVRDLTRLKAIIEGLVFASPEPLTTRTLYKVLSDEPKDDVQAALAALEADYEARGGGLHLVKVAGGYQITSRPELHDWMRRLFHERTTQKLSVPALETLSVIAYRQPVTAVEITEIRGVNTSGVLATLLERNLIKIVGRKNVVGRPFLYGTTREFLIRFGLTDLNDLPRIEDMTQALGFDPPALLVERSVADDMLPLDADDIAAGLGGEPSVSDESGDAGDAPGTEGAPDGPDDDPTRAT